MHLKLINAVSRSFVHCDVNEYGTMRALSEVNVPNHEN